jgi:hypothetical protein
MDKMRLKTRDGDVANVEKIAESFPAVVSEGKVNFEMLRTFLGDEVYGDEADGFTWVGKRDAVREAGQSIRKTLCPCPEESKDWDTTETLYIICAEGTEATKAGYVNICEIGKERICRAGDKIKAEAGLFLTTLTSGSVF